MTNEQYKRMLPYKPIIDLYVKTQRCNEDINGLIDVYEEVNNTKINRNCANCLADMLIICYTNIKNYKE